MFNSKTVLLIIVFFIGYFLGMITYRNDLFPKKQLKEIKNHFFPTPNEEIALAKIHNKRLVANYASGVSLFSDRFYFDKIGNPRLASLYVLQIPRHIKENIEIEINRPVRVYRLLSKNNNNSVFSDLKNTDIKVNVEGISCKHTIVKTKIYPKGYISLPSGGPIASSPILIEELDTALLAQPPLRILN